MSGEKLAAPGKIVLVRRPPPGERPVAFALVMGEALVHVLKAPPRELNGLDDRARPPLAVVDDPALAGLDAFSALARGPAGRGLLAGEHERKQLVCELRRVAEGDAVEVRQG